MVITKLFFLSTDLYIYRERERGGGGKIKETWTKTQEFGVPRAHGIYRERKMILIQKCKNKNKIQNIIYNNKVKPKYGFFWDPSHPKHRVFVNVAWAPTKT